MAGGGSIQLKLFPGLASRLFAGLILIAAPAAQAGCPAFPDVTASIEVSACRFYDAAADDAFRAKVEAYFAPGWDNRTPEDLAARRAETLRRNTGLIITGRAAGAAAAEEFFLLTADSGGCDAFMTAGTPPKSYDFSVNVTCPMVFFAAPVSKVVTFPATPTPPALAPSFRAETGPAGAGKSGDPK